MRLAPAVDPPEAFVVPWRKPLFAYGRRDVKSVKIFIVLLRSVGMCFTPCLPCTNLHATATVTEGTTAGRLA